MVRSVLLCRRQLGDLDYRRRSADHTLDGDGSADLGQNPKGIALALTTDDFHVRSLSERSTDRWMPPWARSSETRRMSPRGRYLGNLGASRGPAGERGLGQCATR